MPKVIKSKRWYQTRLSGFFDMHYRDYEDDILWFVDPAVNQWLFDIPELNTRVELTCDNDGNVTVAEYPMRGIENR